MEFPSYQQAPSSAEASRIFINVLLRDIDGEWRYTGFDAKMFFRVTRSVSMMSLFGPRPVLFHSSPKLQDFSKFFDSSKGWVWSDGELKTGKYSARRLS